MSCLIDTETPPGGRSELHDGQTVAVTLAATIPRIGLKEMGINRPWNWRLTVLKTIRMTLVRPAMTDFKKTVRADCAVSACSSLPPSIKALAPWLWGVELAFGQASALPRTASKIRQTFLSSNLASLLASSLTPLSITLSVKPSSLKQILSILPSPHAPGNHYLLSASRDFSILDIPYQWNHTICGL